MGGRGAPPGGPTRVRVDGLDPFGRGVARVAGKVTFIEGALPGEEVRYRRRRSRGGHDEGELRELVRPAPERVEPGCPHFARCGGCALQHLDHRAQLAHKESWLLEALASIARLEPQRRLAPLIGPQWGYRRRARLGVKHVPGKGVLVGFRERHSPGKVADIECCRVLAPALGERIAALRERLGRLAARARIPQIEVAAGDEGTCLVVRHLDPLAAGDRELLATFACEHGLTILLQPGGPEGLEPLWPDPPPALAYALPEWGLTLGFEPTDFVQVNAAVNRALVARVLELLAPAPGERVLDLYCGIGNFTLPMARRGAAVTGLEGSPTLIERARVNAVRNRLAGIELHAADLDVPEVARGWLARGWTKLLLDPPRSGARAVVAALAPPYPERVCYCSCNPATLARDAATLGDEHGYRLAAAGVVDMFPHTRHVESIALFERR